jgi:hypothetical protein
MSVLASGLEPLRVRKLRTREVVPRTEFPNFRDSGMTVDRALLRILGNLQRKYGESFAAESGLRRMIAEDTGLMPGVDTIPTALERLEAQGLLTQEWLLAGGIKPDGAECTSGTRLVRVAMNRRERFAFAARAQRRNRREGVTRRVHVRALQTFEQARASIAKAVAPPDTQAADAERRRREGLEGLAELAAQWARESPRERSD